MPPSEVTEKLQLHKLKDRVWYVVPSCATTGEGLFEGLVCFFSRFTWMFYSTCFMGTKEVNADFS